jgi:lipoprotein-releasing system ATP-binding protein
MNDSGVVCSGLAKTFMSEAEELHILRGVDLRLEPGQSASVSGKSGCGKSTLLSILGGLDRPSSGSVSVCGVELARANEEALARFRATQVGFVFQSHYLLKDFSALENVMLPAFMLHGNKAAALEAAEALLRAVGLEDRLNHVPAKLSGGERQRVAIARALVNGPALVLADEPTGSLDESAARAVEDLLFAVAAERGAGLLIVTHDPRLAERAERRFVLSDGALSEL